MTLHRGILLSLLIVILVACGTDNPPGDRAATPLRSTIPFSAPVLPRRAIAPVQQVAALLYYYDSAGYLSKIGVWYESGAYQEFAPVDATPAPTIPPTNTPRATATSRVSPTPTASMTPPPSYTPIPSVTATQENTPPPTPATLHPPKPVTCRARVVVQALNVRLSPDTTMPPAGVVTYGTMLDVEADMGNGWLQVKYGGGSRYISRAFVEPNEACQ